MSYTPQNPKVFQAAFAGAMAGIAENSALLSSPSPTAYAGANAAAGAYAQAVDTSWAGASADCLELAVCQTASQKLFAGRSVSPLSLTASAYAGAGLFNEGSTGFGPPTKLPALAPSTPIYSATGAQNDWTTAASTVTALMDSAEAYFAAQGIAVAPCGGSAGSTGTTGGTGTTGITGATGATGSAGSGATFSYSLFFGISGAEGDPDYSIPVPVGSAVPFPQAGPTNGAATAASSSTFNLPLAGDYEVKWQVSVTEAGQLQVALGGAGLPDTVVGRATGTNQIVGSTIITATAGQVLSIINPPGNAAALTVTPDAGGNTPVTATLSIKKVG
jgi:hypothetical protein